MGLRGSHGTVARGSTVETRNHVSVSGSFSETKHETISCTPPRRHLQHTCPGQMVAERGSHGMVARGSTVETNKPFNKLRSFSEAEQVILRRNYPNSCVEDKHATSRGGDFARIRTPRDCLGERCSSARTGPFSIFGILASLRAYDPWGIKL